MAEKILIEIIKDAPDLNAIEKWFSVNNHQNEEFDETTIKQIKETLIQKFHSLSCTDPDYTQERMEQDVASIRQLHGHHPKLVDARVTLELFGRKQFRPTIGENTIELLSLFVESNPKGQTDEFRRAVMRWLVSVIPFPTSDHENELERRYFMDNTAFLDDFVTRSNIPFPIAYDHYVTWWKETVSRFQEEQIPHQPTITWMATSHFMFWCRPYYLTLLSKIETISSDCETFPELLQAFGEVLQTPTDIDCDEIIKNLPSGSVQGEFSSEWVGQTIFQLMNSLMRDKLLTDKGLTLTTKECSPTTLFEKGTQLWPYFVVWYEAVRSNTHNQLLDSSFNLVSSVYRGLFASAKEGTCIVQLLECCFVIPEAYVDSFWSALSLPDALSELKQLKTEIQNKSRLLERYSVVCENFFPESQFSSYHDDEKWKKELTLSAVRTLLRERDSNKESPSIDPFPENLVKSVEWLYPLVKSSLFHLIWNEQSETGLDRLIPASKEWKKIYEELLLSETIRFSRLETVAPELQSVLQQILFAKTAPGFSQEDSEKIYHWRLCNPNQDGHIDKMGSIVQAWTHLHAVHSNISSIIRVLNCLSIFIKSDSHGLESLETVQKAAYKIQTIFKEEEFSEKQVSELSRFTQDSKMIDPCLIHLDPELFETIVESIELLDWLRQSPDDTNFKNSLEEAMGRSEMECPVELWQEGTEGGNPGRVDEKKLSMLSTVRGYLHELIFRPKKRLKDISELLNILRELRPLQPNVIVSLREATKFRLPLMELFGGDSATTAPDRLASLLVETRQTHWVCTNVGKTSPEDQVWLQWTVSKGAGSDLVKKQNTSELMDFQSTLVLSSTEHRTKETQRAIDRFVKQFGWVRQLNENLTQLCSAGHFDYKEYTRTFPLNSSPKIVRDEVLRTRQELELWVEDVQRVREEFYYLNYFSMKNIWKILSAIRKPVIHDDQTSIGGESEEWGYGEFQVMIRLVNPDVAEERSEVERITSLFRDIWFEEQSPSQSAIETLRFCGRILEQGFSTVPTRVRKIKFPLAEAYPAGDPLKGVSVVCSDAPRTVYDQVLSIYARSGYLPERDLVHICRPSSTWDDVNTLLLRWANAHQYGRSGVIYCLGSVEELPFDIQRRVVSAIRVYLTKAQDNPLVLISGQTENQHIVSQFSYCRTMVIPLPLQVIRKFNEEFAHQYSNGIQVFTSPYAGAGKSFSIRSWTEQQDALYVPLVIMNSSNILSRLEELFQELKLSDQQRDHVLVHVDIYDTVGLDFDAILFDLIFLGGLNDSEGNQFSWNPKKTSFALEVASGSDTLEKLRVCSLLPQKIVLANEQTFCTDSDLLLLGMGSEFYSPRYDGTALPLENPSAVIMTDDSNESQPENRHSTAYQRLEYVCLGLELLNDTGGKFWFEFDVETLSKTSRELPNQSARWFNLLINASNIDKQRPSLWCLWNFVNVFYWQLREMHTPDSPINYACMPDPLSHNPDDRESKAQLKGEMIRFLIGTAREFATRQVRKDETNRIAALWVEGMMQPEFNGLWERTDFDHDKRPVFKRRGYQRGVFFLYYRAAEPAWVIDGVVDPSGTAFSRCFGDDLRGLWSTTPDWKDNPNVVVRKISHPDGYDGEAVEVTGCTQDGSSSERENGIYLRQPPYDNIHGKYHYIMMNNALLKGKRRHLFYEDQYWHICRVCTTEYGAYCVSRTANLEGRWRTIPPNFEEDRAVLELLSTEEAQEKRESRPRPRMYRDCPTVVRKVKLPIDIQSDDSTGPTSNTKLDLTIAENEASEKNESPATTVDDPEQTLWDTTIKWNDSNHECLLVSNQNHVVSFLSLNPDLMRKRMHPGLLSHLQRNHINVGEDLHRLSANFHQVLSALTDVHHTPEEAQKILDGKYCLTGDSLLKMLAIFVRLRCGVPVVLMGECGCGKTMLISYLCAWMGMRLLHLDVHGGSTEQDLFEVIRSAESLLTNGESRVFVFLDEINTCSHMGLICELLCHRTLYGRPISQGIYLLAALNPYRRRPRDDRRRTPGLTYQLYQSGGGGNVRDDPNMVHLVYRVHPIPFTLRDFIFDFGALTPDKETLYIQSMVNNNSKLREESLFVRKFISELIRASQIYIRRVEQEPSAASLRDVQRCLNLLEWFQSHRIVQDSGMQVSPIACATVIALAFVYYFRLSDVGEREQYWRELSEQNSEISWKSSELLDSGFESLRINGSFQELLIRLRNSFCNNIDVGEGIALNEALMENLFVVLVCILNRIPVFVVGKPGSSKTLTMQVIASNLQGKQSSNSFWRSFPAVYIFPYQCSPMSDSHSIQHQYEMAVRYQQHAENTITVLLLDEVGLAEHSPDMPLKVLHSMLVDPPIAVVGLSNWVLDPAKMNRAICLQRTEPNEGDILLTGRCIMKSAHQSMIEEKLAPWLTPLAQAYHEIYTNQQGRDFVGMRDYYNLVKLLRSKLAESPDRELDPDLLTFSLCRNFGGKVDLMRKILDTFGQHCFQSRSVHEDLQDDENQLDDDDESNIVRNPNEEILPSIHTIMRPPPVRDLIQENLQDDSARHLMILTKNSVALSLLFGCGLLEERSTKVLIGSDFRDDKTELHLITQINEVKLAMASGSVIVLLNHDNIYEALYDVLNQRYLFKTDSSGKVKKLLRLAVGSRSQLCSVVDGFKIIVIVEQDHAYRNLDLPLLNRFEKQVLIANDVISSNRRLSELVSSLQSWVDSIQIESGLQSKQELFCGFHEGTIPSAVLYLMNPDSNFEDSDDWKASSRMILSRLKALLFHLARPVGINNSLELRSACPGVDYFERNGNLQSVLDHFVYNHSQIVKIDQDEPSEDDDENLHLKPKEIDHDDGDVGAACLILTQSPISHLDGLISKHPGLFLHPYQILQLSDLNSESQFTERVREFYSSPIQETTMLVIQCDPVVCHQPMINHARYLCMKERASHVYDLKFRAITSPKFQRHLIFLIHLPPGIGQRDRQYTLDFERPWTFVFVDDLRVEDQELCDTKTMLTHSAFELVLKGILPISQLMSTRYQNALSSCTTPDVPEVNVPAAFFGQRLQIIRTLLAIPEFSSQLELTIVKILQNLHTRTEIHHHQQQSIKNESKEEAPIHSGLNDSEDTDEMMEPSEDLEIEEQVFHTHVKIAMFELGAGSLRQSLQLALEMLIVQAMAHILRRVDCNFNLSTVRKDSLPLWLALFKLPLVFNCDQIAQTPMVSGKGSKFLGNQPIRTTGLYGPFVAKFPWSFCIVPQLHDRNTRDAVEKLRSRIPDGLEAFSNILKITFGEEVYNLWTAFESGDHMSYLHDFVALASIPLPGLEFQTTLEFYESVIRVSGYEFLRVPGGIHLPVWHSSERIFRICSLMSCKSLPEEARMGLLESVKKAPIAEEGSETSLRAMDERLGVLDILVLNSLLQGLWNRAFDSSMNYYSLQRWLVEFSSVRLDVELYLLSLDSLENSLTGEWTNLKNSFQGLLLVSIFFDEILRELLRYEVEGIDDCIERILKLAKSTQPGSLDFFRSLSDAVSDLMKRVLIDPDDSCHSGACNFFRRYLQQVVFSQHHPSSSSKEDDQENLHHQSPKMVTHQRGVLIDEDFFHVLENIINSVSEANIQSDDHQDECRVIPRRFLSLPLGRMLIDCLENKSNLPWKLRLESTPAKQLFLHHQIETLHSLPISTPSEEEILLAQSSHSPTGESDQDSNSSLESSLWWREYLLSVAKSMVYLQEYARKINHLNQTTENHQPSSSPNLQQEHSPILVNSSQSPLSKLFSESKALQLMLLGESEGAHRMRVWVLKQLFSLGSYDLLGKLIFAPESEFPWLPVDRRMAATVKVQIPDVFVWLDTKDSYERVCNAVRSCATKPDSSELLDTIQKEHIQLSLLFAAIYSQTVLSPDALHPDGMECLRHWIRGCLEKRAPTKTSLWNWVLDGCPGFPEPTSFQNACLQQLAINLSIWTLEEPGSCFASMIFSPQSQMDSYLVSIPDDVFSEIVKISGRVGWYLCPNGHQYSVGQCTMPMELATCTECGAKIGGLDHHSAKGVTRLGDSQLQESSARSGYDLDNNESEPVRLSTLENRVLRLFLHSSMLVSASCSEENARVISQLMFRYTPSDVAPERSAVPELIKRVQFDWKTLRELIGLDDASLGVALGFLFNSLRKSPVSPDQKPVFLSPAERNLYETAFSKLINRSLASPDLKLSLQNTQELDTFQKTSSVRMAIGDLLWTEIQELTPHIEKEKDLDDSSKITNENHQDLSRLNVLWRFRTHVSFELFVNACRFHHVELAALPTLKTFLKVEAKLQYIGGIASVLAWHRILFQAIPGFSMTRLEAAETTNEQILASLPQEKQPEARRVFEQFCRVFNSVLPQVELMWECDENPFLSKDRSRVDLGGGMQMGPDTPISFSLPSVVSGKDQGSFVNSLCTIRILELLAHSQNEVIESISQAHSKRPLLAHQQENDLLRDEQQISALPPLSYLTPSEVLNLKLIVYDREVHLMPLLRTLCSQSLEFGKGAELSFDFAAIQRALTSGLLSGKQPVNLCITHFAFAGDVMRMGRLELIGHKIPQESLSSSLKEQILIEVDTRERLTLLMRHLEVCIEFIASLGTESLRLFSGQTLLETLVLETLQIPSLEWEQVSTVTIRKQISLCHLQSLYLTLEEVAFGNPLDDVDPRYCVDLTDELETKLNSAVSGLNLKILLPLFREFLLKNLSVYNPPPEASLKLNLQETSSEIHYLAELDWFMDHFPSEISMSFAKSTYVFLSRLDL